MEVNGSKYRIYDGQELQLDDMIVCPYCYDEVGSVRAGDESMDFCHNCEVPLEGEDQLVLNSEEADNIHHSPVRDILKTR